MNTLVQPPQIQARRSRASAWTYVVLATFVIVGAVLRFWQIGSRPGWDWDENVYVNIAGNMAKYNSLVLKPEYGTASSPWLFHPPFHFLLLGEWFRLVGIGVTQARVWGASMAIIAIVLLFFALKQMIGEKVALVTTGLLFVDAWMIYSNRVSSIENTLMVLIVLAVWMYWRATKLPTTTKFVAAGVLLGAAACYKFTGAYIIVAVLVNWLIQRQYNRKHLLMLGTTALVLIAYFGAMTVIYWKGGNDWFWKDNGVQLGRTLALNGSRGSVDSVGAMVAPLFHQYRIFVGTVAAAVASIVLIAVRLIQCIKTHSWEPVRRNSVLFGWVVASIVSFGSIGLKFPTYFQLLLVPMYVYLVAELGVTLVKADTKKWMRLLMTGGVLLLVVLGALGFTWRIVDQPSNAMAMTQRWAQLYIPRDAVVLAEQPVGTMIPQQYCNLYRAGACQSQASYIITYRSDQHAVPSNPTLDRLLGHATKVAVFNDFKETVEIWKIRSS